MEQQIFSSALFSPGTVKWDFLSLDQTIPLADQMHHLDEDLLAVEFPNGVTLDVGWYPAMSPEGRFKIVLVQGMGRWEPFAEWQCDSLDELKAAVSKAVHLAKSRANQQE